MKFFFVFQVSSLTANEIKDDPTGIITSTKDNTNTTTNNKGEDTVNYQHFRFIVLSILFIDVGYPSDTKFLRRW